MKREFNDVYNLKDVNSYTFSKRIDVKEIMI